MRPLAEALRFLTLLPVPGLPRDAPPQLAHAAVAFPLVGLLVGGVGVVCGFAAGALFGDPLLRATCTVLAWVAVTGGLHQDGLADTCDALFSWRPRARRLAILRDSRIGTMGVLGLVAALGLQVASLAALGEQWWRAALVAPVMGRWAAAQGLVGWPAARDDGAFQHFRRGVRPGDGPLAAASALLLVAALWWPLGLVAGAVAVPCVLGLHRAMAGALGGLTGDTLGASCEAAVTAALLALVAASAPSLGAAAPAL